MTSGTTTAYLSKGLDLLGVKEEEPIVKYEAEDPPIGQIKEARESYFGVGIGNA